MLLVLGFRFGAQVLGFRVEGCWDYGFVVQVGVWGLGLRVNVLGFRVGLGL